MIGERYTHASITNLETEPRGDDLLAQHRLEYDQGPLVTREL